MGAIKLATSNSADEEYGGTFVPSSYKLVWSGEKYTVNDNLTIPDFDKNKKYLFVFRSFSGAGFTSNFVVLGFQTQVQITFWGDSQQFVRYRFGKASEESAVYGITGDSSGTASNNALIKIYEI